jgi:hypothetical protein
MMVDLLVDHNHRHRQQSETSIFDKKVGTRMLTNDLVAVMFSSKSEAESRHGPVQKA